MAALRAKSVLPMGLAAQAAWRGGLPPPLCAPIGEQAPPVKHLEGTHEPEQQAGHSKRPEKSFQMHIGASLSIPTRDAKELPLPQYRPQPTAAQREAEQSFDPFEGLPFRGMAEKMGAAVLPTLQAARDAERQAKRQARRAAEEAEVVVPVVPHVLPFTRWAASSQKFRSTFIAEPPKERKKARLSWYHPDDTLVPRDWFRMGLLEDLKYYSPFGLFGGNKEPASA